jgi:hypothetical protein
MATPTKIAAARATDRLTKAQLDLAGQGLRTHCADRTISHLWLSENDAERALAAKLCIGCPVQIACWNAAAARREQFGVWAGVDLTRKPRRHGKKIEAA